MTKYGSESERSTAKDSERDKPNNEQWGSSLAFIVTAVGSAIGIGNVWRFPAKSYEYGGGAFFVPYFLAFFTIGIPLLILELGLGQHFQGGNVRAWGRMNPRFRMVGFSGIFMGFFLVSYYSPLVAWFVRMFCYCFTNGSEDVRWTIDKYKYRDDGSYNWVQTHVFGVDGTIVEDYIPTDMEWGNVACLIFVYLSSWICLAFGVKVTGILSYVTVSLPTLMIIILLCTSMTLPGSDYGVKKYIGEWDLTVLREKPIVWTDAAAQILFSTGVVIGFMCAFGSYADPRANITKYSTIIATCNSAYSIVAGFAVFAALGYLAHLRADYLIKQSTAPSAHQPPENEKPGFIYRDSTWTDQQFSLGQDFLIPVKDAWDREVEPATYAFDKSKYVTWFDNAANCGTPDTCVAPCEIDAASGICTRGLALDEVLETMSIKGARGFALAFGTYPVVLSELEYPHFWNAMFFLALYFLGVDTIYGILEGSVNCARETLIGQQFSRMSVVTAVIISSFLTCLPYCTNAGFYILDCVDHYVCIILIWVAFIEFTSCGWCRGWDKTVQTCGLIPSIMLPMSVFGPIFFASAITFGLTASAEANGVESNSFAQFLSIFLVFTTLGLALTIFLTALLNKSGRRHSELVWELFFGNVEDLRLMFNSYFVQDYRNAKWYCGIPKYFWGFCIKFWAPPILVVLLLIHFLALKNGEEEGATDGLEFGRYGDYPVLYQVLSIFIVMVGMLLVIVGLIVPPAVLQWMDPTDVDILTLKREADDSESEQSHDAASIKNLDVDLGGVLSKGHVVSAAGSVVL